MQEAGSEGSGAVFSGKSLSGTRGDGDSDTSQGHWVLALPSAPRVGGGDVSLLMVSLI